MDQLLRVRKPITNERVAWSVPRLPGKRLLMQHFPLQNRTRFYQIIEDP